MRLGLFVIVFGSTIIVTDAKSKWQTSKTNAEEEATTESASQPGCTSKFLLPDRPFIVIWNHPSGGCEAQGIDLNLTAWGIVENKGDAFGGDMIRIYYDFGNWPTLFRNGSVRTNGGVPQRGDIFSHLSQIKSQVEKDITTDFDGVAVIDMESWRPRFEHNYDSLWQYQNVSINIVKALYPHLNKTQTAKEAAREFNNGAQMFLEGSLNLTTAMRPGGYWGYYGFPRNWGGASGQAANDNLYYMWGKSRALLPEIYMYNSEEYEHVKTYIKGQVNETLRVYAKFSSPDTLILPYTLCNNNGTDYFSTENLTLAIGMPGQMGAGGVVIWGSSGDFHTRNECHILQDYIRNTLGPYVQNLTAFLSACSSSLCSGHGRCVEKDLESLVQLYRQESRHPGCAIRKELLSKTELAKKHRKVGKQESWSERFHSADKLSLTQIMAKNMTRGGAEQRNHWVTQFNAEDVNIHSISPYDNYICRCLQGWSGDNCQNHI